MDERQAKNHVNLVAILHIALGALTLLGGIITFIVLNFTTNFVPIDDEIALKFMEAFGVAIALVIGILGLIDVLAGISLFTYKEWSRILVIVISAINCLNIPIGTAKGVYSIWALMKPEVQELFS